MNPDQPTPALDLEMVESLRKAGLLSDVKQANFQAQSGSVSSDIWRIEADGRVFCVKRALAKLKVAADWFAPVERDKYEVA